MSKCQHKELFFGSGGYYVFCRHCGAGWVARKRENDEIDYSRSNDGLTTGDKRMSEVDRTAEDIAQDLRITTLRNDVDQLRVIVNQLLVTVSPLQELEDKVLEVEAKIGHVIDVLGGVKA